MTAKCLDSVIISCGDLKLENIPLTPPRSSAGLSPPSAAPRGDCPAEKNFLSIRGFEPSTAYTKNTRTTHSTIDYKVKTVFNKSVGSEERSSAGAPSERHLRRSSATLRIFPLDSPTPSIKQNFYFIILLIFF